MTLENRVDERRHGGPLDQHDESSEDHHHHQDGDQPVLLAFPHEGPKLGEKRHQNWRGMPPGAGPGGVRSIQLSP